MGGFCPGGFCLGHFVLESVLLNFSTHRCTNHDSTKDVGSEEDECNVYIFHNRKPLISYDP